MIIHSVAQGTQKWLDLRKGIPTCSRFDEIVTPAGELSKSAPKYMQHLLAERILNRPIDGFKSQYMEHGNDYEDRAIAAYEWERNCTTKRVGFVTSDDGRIGCSPDRFIEDDDRGMVEAKAPTPAVHVGYLLAAAGASKEYKVQMQGELWMCEKVWNDVISYCPGMPDAIFRVNRDETFIGKMSRAVREFSDLLESLAADFEKRGWIKPQSSEKSGQLDEGLDFLGVNDDDLARIMAAQEARRNAV
jgi:hypothetical protein